MLSCVFALYAGKIILLRHIYYYYNLLFCFAFVIFCYLSFLFTIVIRLKHTQKMKILVI